MLLPGRCLEDRSSRPVRRRRPTGRSPSSPLSADCGSAIPAGARRSSPSCSAGTRGSTCRSAWSGRILTRLRATGPAARAALPPGVRPASDAGRGPTRCASRPTGRSRGPATSSSSTPSTSGPCPTRPGSSSPPVTASAAGMSSSCAATPRPARRPACSTPSGADAVPGPRHQRRQRLRVQGAGDGG